jgi:hypothetical protein
LGNTYTVIKLAGAVAIKRTSVGGAVSTVMPNTPDWTRAAILLLNAHKNSGVVAGKPKSMFKPSTRSGSSSGSGSSSSAAPASAPAWASQPYVAEIAALVGFTGASATTPGIAYTVRMVDIGGVAAPAIDVASGDGVTGSTGATATITPEGATWVASALEVFAAKSAKDAGLTLPTGSTTPGTITVTGMQTGSEGSVWSSESVPSSDAALVDQAQQTVDAAIAEGGMTVSSGNFMATGASALAKYKWFIVAGVGVAGFYYARRAGWLK